MAKQNFKELNDGRYRIILAEDTRQILIDATNKYRNKLNIHAHETCLADEAIIALSKEVIKLRRSEFFLIFSRGVQEHVEPGTQMYLNSWLNLDEVKRQIIQQSRLMVQKRNLLY